MSAEHTGSSLPPAISVTGLRRVYDVKPKPVVALAGVDLEVAPGEFFGLLGPNGAGKTTLIKILTTLLLPSEGTARASSASTWRPTTKRIRRIMNMVAGGEQSGYGILTVREQLWMFSQFYGLAAQGGLDARRRADRGRRASATQRLQRVSTLSTGQRQKMNMARGLLNDPWILFLDEPTLGLDVAAARGVRELVLAWKAAVPGRTVLLTTHYMAEADELCERIAIVDHGRILAIGTPGRAQAARPARVDLPAGARPPRRRSAGARAAAGRRLGRAAPPDTDRRGASAWPSTWCSRRTARWAASSPPSPASAPRSSPCASREPTLEDVFVELVGRGFADEADAGAPEAAAAGRASPTSPPSSASDHARRARA